MRRLWTILFLGMAVGCGSKGNEQLLAKPVACTNATQCQPGEVCSNKFCAPPAPTSSNYAACGLDADCRPKDYCSLGACAHDCVTDQDCTSGLVCTSRGRCIAKSDVSSAPAIESPPAPSLEVVAGAAGAGLTFARGVEQQTMTLRSTTGSTFRYRILASDPWLSAEPPDGKVTGDPLTITVNIDRKSPDVKSQGLLTVSSAAGSRKVNVFVAKDLTGRFAGNIEVTQPYAFAESSIALDLFDRGDGTLTGYVEPASSSVFPVKSVVSGTVAGNEVTLTFVVGHIRNSDGNPWLGRDVKRTVTLTGNVSGFGSIAGTVQEEVEGILDANSNIHLAGTFQLGRVGAATPGAGTPQPIGHSLITSPFSADLAASCQALCQSADACLKQSATFYDWFASMNANGQSAFAALAAPGKVLNASIASPKLACAQYYSSLQLAKNPSSAATTALLDSLEVAVDYALLFGNQRTVDALTAWKTPGALASELATLTEANKLFLAAAHPPAGSTLATMLDPYLANQLLRSGSLDAISSGASNLPTALKDPSPRASFEHLRRQLGATTALLRVNLEIAKRQHRLGRPADAIITAKRALVGAYLDMALLGGLMRTANADGLAEVSQVLQAFKDLTQKFDQLAAGENPVGLSDGYVPFLLDLKQAALSNFQQILSTAQVQQYQGVAAKAQADAKAELRAFETSETSLKLEVLNQQLSFGQQLTSLCGSENLSDCFLKVPISGTEMSNAVGEVNIASARVLEANQNISNLRQEIQIEQQRVRAVTGIRDAEAKLLLEDGKTVVGLDWDQRELNYDVGSLNNLAEINQTIATSTGPGNWGWGAAGAVISGALRQYALMMTRDRQGQIDEQRANLQALQSARVQWTENSIDQATSEATIKTKLLQIANLDIELLTAGQALSQAIDHVDSVIVKARYLDAERSRFAGLEDQKLNDLLQFRLYTSDLERKAAASFESLMKWAYLATRAMEYELNITYAFTSELWASRSADEINAYLVDLNAYYILNKPLAPQDVVDVLSLRDDILDLSADVKDHVTGQTTSARERFRRYVADPANRDANGNLQIDFSTLRPDKAFFAKTVCNDRIVSVRVNLVGDDLGAGVTAAYVFLSQGGLNYQRSCADSSSVAAYDLSERSSKRRTARIQAGVNSPNRLAAGQENTDLVLRSVLANSWRLNIDTRREMEPSNARLKLAGLDDIELIIKHEACTIQQ